LKTRVESRFLQYGRAQFRCQRSRGCNRIIDQLLHFLCSLLNDIISASAQNCQPELGCNQQLLKMVMQDNCQAAPFPLLCQRQFTGEGSQLRNSMSKFLRPLFNFPFERGICFLQCTLVPDELFLRLLAFGDVLHQRHEIID